MPLFLSGYVSFSKIDPQLKIDTCRFVAKRSALLGYCKDCLVWCQDNVTKWDISVHSLISVEQHYKVTVTAHCHKSVLILI